MLIIIVYLCYNFFNVNIFYVSRINQTEDIDEYGVENAESNKNKKKEKKIKFYPSFESIKGQIFRICKYLYSTNNSFY